jgi:hypothetical protein
MRLPSRLGAHPARAPGVKVDFRRQYRDLERQRTALSARLAGLGRKAQAHPAYERALTLLNDIFRKSSVAQRRAVLDAADWSIGLLDRLTAPSKPGASVPARKISRVLRPAAKSPRPRFKKR